MLFPRSDVYISRGIAGLRALREKRTCIASDALFRRTFIEFVTMHVMIKIIYLIALLPYIPLWFFFYRKGSQRIKKEMLVMSVLCAAISPIASYLWWNKDWWQPPSILSVGGVSAPEDILLGFLFTGVSAVIYDFAFKKNLRHTAVSHTNAFVFLIVTSLVVCAALFSLIKVTSFTAITIAMVLATVGILSVRRDLIRSSLYSGLLTLLVAFPFYILIYIMSPGWSVVTYKFGTLSGMTVYGFPIEEFIFWFFYGLVIGPIYEYAKGWGFEQETNH